jgi:hypothetical protein
MKVRCLTSNHKIKANRANALASTGPKTAHGRARAARNALRHALTLPLCSNPALSEEVEALARKIAGPDANAETKKLARELADAEIDLCRVRYARHHLLSDCLSNQYYDSRANTRMKIKLMHGLLQTNAQVISTETLVNLVTSTPQGPHKLALILTREAERLVAMDRYERRALSRRKFAIRAFDAAKQAANVGVGRLHS